MLGQPSYRNPLKIPIDVYLAPDIILLQTGFGLNHSVCATGWELLRLQAAWPALLQHSPAHVFLCLPSLLEVEEAEVGAEDTEMVPFSLPCLSSEVIPG